MRRPGHRLALASACLLCASAARAQAPLLDQQARSALWVDVLRPWFTTGGSPSALIVTPGVRVALGRHLTLTAELPFVRAEPPAGAPPGAATFTRTGNPYFGVRWKVPDTGVQLEFGGRPPLERQDTSTIDAPTIAGAFGDADRFDAYTPDLATVIGRITKSTVSDAGFEVRVSFGIKAAIPVRGNPSQTLILGVGSAFLGYLRPWIELLGGVTANARINGVPDPLNDTVNEQIQLGAMLRTRYVRPSIGLRIPLSDNLSRITRFVAQGGLVVPLP